MRARHPCGPARWRRVAQCVVALVLCWQAALTLALFAVHEPALREPCGDEAEDAPQPWAAVSVVSPLHFADVLARCPPVLHADNGGFQDFIFARTDTCGNPATLEDFICTARCAANEPELERTIGVLSLANHSFAWPVQHCHEAKALYLMWIRGGRVHFVACAVGLPRSRRAYERVRAVFATTLHVLHLVACLVELPDVVFLFNPTDLAQPSDPSPPSPLAYMEPLPPTFRFVGTRAHAGILFPTDSFIINSAFCAFRGWGRSALSLCKKQYADALVWSARSSKVMWRGLPTGTPWANTTWRHTQRVALVRDYGHRTDLFDIGFTQPAEAWSAGFTPQEAQDMERAWALKDQVSRSVHGAYKHLVHVDGHGASWGLIHKLQSGSATLLVQSSRDFREHYYVHLEPMEHYVPVRPDLRDLEAIAQWLQTPDGDFAAQRIAQRAQTLVESRLRPQDTLCYVARALHSIARLQTVKMTPQSLAESLGPLAQRAREFKVGEPDFNIVKLIGGSKSIV